MFGRTKTKMVTPEDALPGRDTPLQVPNEHYVNGNPIKPPFPDGMETAVFGMGCFWGAERLFWQRNGVYTTAAGYAGGYTPNPTYEETCTARTGHTETALVAYDPTKVTEEELLKIFWERHDPTQGFRQGNDVGTQYRSAIYWTAPEQAEAAQETAKRYAEVLSAKGYDAITTEIAPAAEAGPFYYAEDYHQQYLSDAKNPNGYRCHATTGVPFPDAA